MITKFRRLWAMAPVPGGEGDPAVPTGASADAPTGQPATPAPAEPADAVRQFAESTGYRNVDEVKAALKASRENEKLLRAMKPVFEQLQKQQTPTAPAPATQTQQGQPAQSEVQQMRAELALRDALDERAVPKEQRKIIRRLFNAERPTDVDAWLEDTLPITASTAPAPQPSTEATPSSSAPARSAPVPSDRGAPASPLSTALPKNLKDIKPEVWASMSDKEKVAYLNRWGQSHGGGIANPLRQITERRKALQGK